MPHKYDHQQNQCQLCGKSFLIRAMIGYEAEMMASDTAPLVPQADGIPARPFRAPDWFTGQFNQWFSYLKSFVGSELIYFIDVNGERHFYCKDCGPKLKAKVYDHYYEKLDPANTSIKAASYNPNASGCCTRRQRPVSTLNDYELEEQFDGDVSLLDLGGGSIADTRMGGVGEASDSSSEDEEAYTGSRPGSVPSTPPAQIITEGRRPAAPPRAGMTMSAVRQSNAAAVIQASPIQASPLASSITPLTPAAARPMPTQDLFGLHRKRFIDLRRSVVGSSSSNSFDQSYKQSLVNEKNPFIYYLLKQLSATFKKLTDKAEQKGFSIRSTVMPYELFFSHETKLNNILREVHARLNNIDDVCTANRSSLKRKSPMLWSLKFLTPYGLKLILRESDDSWWYRWLPTQNYLRASALCLLIILLIVLWYYLPSHQQHSSKPSPPPGPPSPSPTSAPTPSTPASSPTSAPTPSTPASSPTPAPTSTPASSPTSAPTPSTPASPPTSAPTSTPTPAPTSAPTPSTPASPPTSAPTSTPTPAPTSAPTPSPTSAPTPKPTSTPMPGPDCNFGNSAGDCSAEKANHFALFGQAVKNNEKLGITTIEELLNNLPAGCGQVARSFFVFLLQTCYPGNPVLQQMLQNAATTSLDTLYQWLAANS